MKQNKVFCVLLAIVVICIALIYQSSYAKYVKGVDSRVNLKMARWNIKVNNESVLGKDTLTETIVAYFPPSTYINEGVIAPGARGYFDVSIDPTDVDVAFSYELAATSAADDIPDVVISSYEVVGVSPSDITYTPGTPIGGTFPLGSTPVTYRMYVEWLDGAGSVMDNSEDTQVAVDYANIPFVVSLRFTQIHD